MRLCSHMTISEYYTLTFLKNKEKKYYTVETIPKSNGKTPRNRVTISTPNTQIHDGSLSQLRTGTSITSGGDKLVKVT